MTSSKIIKTSNWILAPNTETLVGFNFLLPDSSGGGLIYTATNKGIFQSPDRGISWSLCGLEGVPITALSCVYPSSSDPRLIAASAGTVATSSDNGRNWIPANFNEKNVNISCLCSAWNDIHAGPIFAGTLEDGFFISDDGGRNWKSRNFRLLDLCVLTIAVSPEFSKDQTILIGTNSMIFRSHRAGQSWSDTKFQIDTAPVQTIVLSPDYSRDGLGFAGSQKGLLITHDHGHTWLPIRDISPDISINSILLSHNFFEDGIAIAASDKGILITSDRGANWITFDTSDDVISIALILESQNQYVLIISTQGGGINRLTFTVNV